jgi:hypothetical protein
MQLVQNIVQDFTPAAAGIWVLVFMFLRHVIQEWRLNRRLSLDDRLAKREGYAAQVASLTAENRQLRVDLQALEHRHDNYRQLCHKETDQLRDQVVTLENRISGFLRKVADLAIRASRGESETEIVKALVVLAGEADPHGGM